MAIELYGAVPIQPLDISGVSDGNVRPGTGKAERMKFFDDKQQAIDYLDDQCQYYTNTVADTRFGQNLTETLTMRCPGMLYHVSVPDDLFKAMQSRAVCHEKFGYMYDAPFGIMKCNATGVYFPSDMLHSAAEVPTAETYKVYYQRFMDFQPIAKSLENTTEEFLRSFNPNDSDTRMALQRMFGENGVVVTDYDPVHNFQQQLRNIEKPMVEAHVGLQYIIAMMPLDTQYMKTYVSQVQRGASLTLAQLTAADKVLNSLQRMAWDCGDEKAYRLFTDMSNVNKDDLHHCEYEEALAEEDSIPDDSDER